MVEQITSSSAFKQFARTAGTESYAASSGQLAAVADAPSCALSLSSCALSLSKGGLLRFDRLSSARIAAVLRGLARGSLGSLINTLLLAYPLRGRGVPRDHRHDERVLHSAFSRLICCWRRRLSSNMVVAPWRL